VHDPVLDLERDPHVAWIPCWPQRHWSTRLVGAGVIQQRWNAAASRSFSVVLALVHLFTFFMVVRSSIPMIRIDKRLIEAAYDAGATGWQTLVNIVIRCRSPASSSARSSSSPS